MGRKWAELAVARRGGSGKPYPCALNSLPFQSGGVGNTALVAPLSAETLFLASPVL